MNRCSCIDILANNQRDVQDHGDNDIEPNETRNNRVTIDRVTMRQSAQAPPASTAWKAAESLTAAMASQIRSATPGDAA